MNTKKDKIISSIPQKILAGILTLAVFFGSIGSSVVSTAYAAKFPLNSGMPTDQEQIENGENKIGASAIEKEIFIASDRSTTSGDIDPISFVGIKKSRTSKILDNFKEQQRSLLVDNAPFTPDEEVGLFEAEKRIHFLEQMMEKIEQDKSELKDQKREITSKKFTLQSLIEELDGDIEAKVVTIDTTELKLKDKNREISELLQNIVDLQHKIDANKEAILGYLAYVYKKGDGLYDNEQEFDIIKTLVFTDGNVSDVLANYHFLTIVEITGQNFLEERRRLLSEFYVKSQTLKTQRRNLADLKRQLLEEQQSLQTQREFKEFLLQRTMGREALFNEYISEQKEKQDIVEARLASIQELYTGAFESIATRYGCSMDSTGGLAPIDPQNTVACQALATSFDREKQLREYVQGVVPSNPLAWPVDGTYISSYFQDADYYSSVGSSHE